MSREFLVSCCHSKTIKKEEFLGNDENQKPVDIYSCSFVINIKFL